MVVIGFGPLGGVLHSATHSWDLARATGQDASLPDDLAATVLAVGQGFITEEIRSFAGFGDAVELDAQASTTDQLVTFLGRQP